MNKTTVQDSIRDEIADIRFSRRKIAANVNTEEERAYAEHCLSRVRWLFASRHTLKPNKFGYFESPK